MDEINVKKFTEEVTGIISCQDSPRQARAAVNEILPEKRVHISKEEIAFMEQYLEHQLEEKSTQEPPKASERPTSPEEAIPGAGGYKLDGGKPRWELAPFDAFESLVQVLTWAADKKIRGDRAYPARNWERGMHWSRPFGAMMRHAWKWWQGKLTGGSTVDEESGMSHIWHAFTCAGFLVAYENRKLTNFDDRPTSNSDE